MKGEIGSNTILIGYFNTLLTSSDRSSRHKVNTETVSLNDTLDQIVSTDLYRTFHPKTTEYTFSLSAHGTFSRTDHMSGHKTSLTKSKKTEIISCIFSKHNSMKLKINYKKNWEKHKNTWRLSNMLLNNQWVNKEIKEEVKKNTRIPVNMKTQSLGHSNSSSKRDIYSAIGLPQETREISNKPSKPTPKETTKRRINTAQS